MSRRKRPLDLPPEDRAALEQMRAHHPKPYVRERAAALLKVAAGQAAHAVALHGLLQERDPDTVYGWLDGYAEHGLESLPHKPRRQRDLSPQRLQELQETVRQAPPALAGSADPPPARWSLAYVRQTVPWLADYSLGGLWELLADLDLRYRRGRHAVHSPDLEYGLKREYAQACVAAAWGQPERVVALYLDELTYYRQPSLASDWCPDKHTQPRAHLSHRSNTTRRIVGALDAVTGRVLTLQGAKIGVHKLAAFYGQIRDAYPQAQKIYALQDNWPVHQHPEVLAAAQAARVQPVFLPTYAPWLNPIEKLWRKLKQEVLHLHRLSDRWEELQQRVQTYLERLAQGSRALLHYVGLLPDYQPG